MKTLSFSFIAHKTAVQCAGPRFYRHKSFSSNYLNMPRVFLLNLADSVSRLRYMSIVCMCATAKTPLPGGLLTLVEEFMVILADL